MIENRINSFAEAQAYTRQYAKTFYFASHVLPPEKRKASYAVYAFCRYADNVADVASGVPADAAAVAGRLTDLRTDIHALYEESGKETGAWAALRETIYRYRIPKEYFLDLVRGIEMDLTRSRYETFEELREYCYCVASVVGLVMTRVFGASSSSADERAIDMGIAMQLTNILRDVREDLALGRVYLPQEDLRRFGYEEADLRHSVVDERFRRLMQFQLARAREYYARAEEGIAHITDDGSRFCVRVMSGLYAGILDVIEKNDFDVFTRRAFVPLPAKLLHTARLALKR